jgi:hypothetical protein
LAPEPPENPITDNTQDDPLWKPLESVNSVYWSNENKLDEEWLIDSRATVNVTRSDNVLENATSCNQTITVGNGDKANVMKQGNIVLKEKNTGMLITIQVMVCPQFLLNILSMKKILEKGHTVTLNSDEGFIECRCHGSQDKTKLDLIQEGKDGMYYVIGTRVPQKNKNQKAFPTEAKS